MKKLKIKKHMFSFLMLAVMVVSIIGIMPATKVHASTFISLETTKLDDNNEPIIDNGSKEHCVYQFQTPGHNDVHMICVYSPYKSRTRFIYIFLSEDSDFNSVKGTCVYDNGDTVNYDIHNSGTASNHIKTYKYVWSEIDGGHYDFKYNATTKFTTSQEIDSHGFEGNTYDRAKYVQYYVENYLNYGDEWVSVDGNPELAPDGSQDKPYEDKDIGTIVLKSHGFISTKNDQFMGDVSCSYDYYFKYKDKTSSGFSLTDNKYARTFIEVKVQNQCVLYNKDKDNEDIIEEYYPHYGEYYTYKKFPLESINNNTLRVGWGDIYSKWNDYSEHPLATNKKLAYRFMIRVVCTDSLTVIPDETSGWHAGGWRSILFDGDKFVEETNGHVDNDGKWKDDKDDGHNNSSDKTSHNNESKDDVDKILNDDSDSSAGSSGIAGIKSFLKDVGNVPKAIGKLFSFLPSWCTDFIAFGFVVLVALMIIKAIRG